MKRMAVLLVLVVLTAAGSASAAPATQRPVLPEVDVLAQNNPFPREGLLVTQGQRTLLVGLDGRPYARLRGARPAWFASANSGRNAAFQELAMILQDRRLFVGPRGSWYVLDQSGRLQPLGSPRIRLFGDIEVAARAVPTRDGAFKVDPQCRASRPTGYPCLCRASAHLREPCGWHVGRG